MRTQSLSRRGVTAALVAAVLCAVAGHGVFAQTRR
jgi:hypothetical protein